MRVRCLALLFGLLALPVRAGELKVATWNLNWLTSREAGLPADVKPREPEDFDRLRAYAGELNADVVAFQEVDNRETARRVFSPDRYSLHMSRDHVRQRVGLAIRGGLTYEINPDVTALAGDPARRLRSGVDITLTLPSGPLRVMALHLKTGCQYASLGNTPRGACATLLWQLDAVTAWVAARQEDGVPFLLLGDFNRGMDRRDAFLKRLRTAAPLTRVTEGDSNPCWGGEPFIDHILLGGAARVWAVPNSLRVLTYRETDPAWKARLSDHCPVSARLAVPD